MIYFILFCLFFLFELKWFDNPTVYGFIDKTTMVCEITKGALIILFQLDVWINQISPLSDTYVYGPNSKRRKKIWQYKPKVNIKPVNPRILLDQTYIPEDVLLQVVLKY